MGERLPKVAAALVVALGLAAVLAGLSVFVEAWQASRAWAGTGEVDRVDGPSEEPIWVETGGSAPFLLSSSDVGPVQARHRLPESPIPVLPPISTGDADDGHAEIDPATSVGLVAVRPASEAGDPPEDRAVAPAAVTSALPARTPADTAAPADVELVDVEFRFLDPPEPGAHARLAVSLVNGASVHTGPLSVTLPVRWLQSFELFGAIPSVLDDRARGDGERQLVFGGLAPGERRTVELHVLATAEEVDGPEVRIILDDDEEIGRARPRTVAPRPRPGPARTVSIPKLGVRASVVPVPWEPPPFVVGQLHGTAAVSEGNTVLIGHLAGPWGDVFARLDRLRPGDEVVAISRGLEYRFVVSEIAVKPYDDLMPTRPTESPRLTLMTCTGQWSITRQDYSHRLWVVAEPPELAQQTIRANAERAAQAAREAEAAAGARATHEAEVAKTPSATETTPTEEGPSAIAGAATPGAAPASAEAAPPGIAAVRPAASAEAVPAASADGAPAVAEEIVPGIVIDAPSDLAAVPRRFVVRGRRAVDADDGAPLWLLVRAEVVGSHWYALDHPLELDGDGLWHAEVELGGPPGIRHEIRVGVVDEAADRALRRLAAERTGQPLDDLPEGFRSGARVVVERR